MSEQPPPPSAPAPGPRALPQRHAIPAGALSGTHALLLAWLTHLIALLGLRPATPRARHALLAAAWHHPVQPAPEPAADDTTPTPHVDPRHLARILYALGPRPNRGMRALCATAPAPRQTPPIRPPPIGPAAPAAGGLGLDAPSRPYYYDIIIKITPHARA